MKIKNIFLVLFTIALSQFTYAQEATGGNSKLLESYYLLKDALVSSDANLSSSSAQLFVQALNNEANRNINSGLRKKLLKDATSIAKSADLEQQRKSFAALSANMIELAKVVKLSPQPIYEQHCPMQKASWLSNEKEIKNPYYGNAMLTCGSVKSTF